MEECILGKENITLSDSYLIILGAGPQQIPAFKVASRLGLKTLAVDYNPEAKAIKFADKFLLASVKNKEECLDKLKRLSLRYTGVITSGVEVSPVVSAIAREFNLIGTSEEVAYNTTNKCARSTILREAGLPIPKFEIMSAFSSPPINYPFVIKPSDNSGSRGVRIVDSEKKWSTAYYEAHSLSSDGRVIIEELLYGNEISIEGFVLNGKMIVTDFSDRNYIRGYYPYFMEDGSSSPTRLEPSTVAEAKKVFSQAAEAIGVNAGPSKGDLIVTKEGVKVLEVNSRLAPAFSMSTPLTTGVDILEATIRWATGMPVPRSIFQPEFHKAMAHRYYFHKGGRITKIEGTEGLKDQPGVKEVVFLSDFAVGDILEPPTYIKRLFYIITVDDDRDIAIKMAQEALKTVSIEVEPVRKKGKRANVSV
jgi:biotin carboxylase